MPELWSADGHFARFIIERGTGAIYVIAFVVAALQFPALCGERGLEPIGPRLAASGFRAAPSLFHWHYSDRLLRVVSWTGAMLGLTVVLGLASAAPLPITMSIWLALWALYLSIVNVGGTFYGFGWESQLVETGFLAIFLGNAATAPPLLVIVLFRWLAFRVEFGAGLIKMRGDPCWRDLTCLDFHHETQPLPNPLSWYAHHAPRLWHRIETLGNHVAQLILPFGLFLPQPFASIAAVLMIGTQLWLILTGNYSWLNWITIMAIVAGLSDSVLRGVLPVLPAPGAVGEQPLWFTAATVGLTVLIVALSYWPVRNLLSRRQRMNASFNGWRLVNTYGAFGSVTRDRYEVVVEGTDADDVQPDTEWREYEFKAKPGDPSRRPPQVAPYHVRLDWMMWFLPLSPAYAGEWFLRFLIRLLEADGPTLRLLRRDPFAGTAPRYVRARLFLYRFTTRQERRETGAWWDRAFTEELMPPLALRRESVVARDGARSTP